MSRDASWRWIARLGLSCVLLVAVPLHAQTGVAAVQGGPSQSASSAAASGSAIDSVERADDVIRDVARQRVAVAAQYTSDQQACSTVFLMTRCLDAARERRREALAKLRVPEIEANAFKRRARVTERDQALEEKQLKSEQAASTEQRGLTIREPGKAAAAAKDAASESQPRVAKPPMVVRPEKDAAQHTPKPLTAPISAATEARNRASFDRKAAESVARQREIAEKKAEKERDRAAKKARDAAAQTAPAVP